MKIKFYLEKKVSKYGDTAIYCYVRELKKTLTLNTGERVKPEFWDSAHQRADIRKTRDNIQKKYLRDMNQYLDSYSNKIWEIVRDIRRKDPSAGFNKLSEAIKRAFERKENSLLDIYDEFLLSKKHVSKASLQKLKRVGSLLKEYQDFNNEKLELDNINPAFFEKYYSFLIDNAGMINNTAHKTIQFLKSFFIWANVNHYTNNDSYKSFKIKSIPNEIVYLTEEELLTLYNLELDQERLKKVRDIFVFQCFTGVRYSDIQNISKDDIRNGTWHIITQKTRQSLQIPLNAFAISVLAKYSGAPKPLPTISNQKMNKYLKELCEIAGIKSNVKIVKFKGAERVEETYKKYEIIGTHTARRTFVSLSLQKGMKPDVIMAITGHKTYKMMQKYLKIADAHKRQEMDKIWGPALTVYK